MTRTLFLILFFAGPASADLPADLDQDAFLDAINHAGAQATRLEDIVAPNGIKTSQMQPDGTTPITFKDGSTRDVQLDFIGGYHDGVCDWALQFPSGTQFNFIKGLQTQARLQEEGWPPSLTGSTTALSEAECNARAALVTRDNPCMALLPIAEDGTVFHFGVDIPELCQ